MSPLNRVGVFSLLSATVMAGGFVFWMTVHFNVPWSNVHWWLFGFLWLTAFGGFYKAGIEIEALRFMGRNIERDQN
jgi:hypothetical protein